MAQPRMGTAEFRPAAEPPKEHQETDVLLKHFREGISGANWVTDQLSTQSDLTSSLRDYISAELFKDVKKFEDRYEQTGHAETTHWSAAIRVLKHICTKSGTNLPETIAAVEKFGAAEHAGYANDFKGAAKEWIDGISHRISRPAASKNDL